MNSYARIYDILTEDSLEEGKVKDFLKNAALVGVAAAAGRMGAMTTTETPSPSRGPRAPLSIGVGRDTGPKRLTPSQQYSSDESHPLERPRKPKSKGAKSILARIKSISPRSTAPFSSDYRTTTTAGGQVTKDIADKAARHKKINPNDPAEKARRAQILTAWKKKHKTF